MGFAGANREAGVARPAECMELALTEETEMNEIVTRLDAIAEQLKRIGDILEGCANGRKEGKENIPPTPPIREKEGTHTNTPRACVCEGFLVPTLAEVAAYVKANGLSVDAEKFWNHYNAIGWRVGKSPIRCWQSVCRVWERGDRRTARIEAERLAHFDAKAEEPLARPPPHRGEVERAETGADFAAEEEVRVGGKVVREV